MGGKEIIDAGLVENLPTNRDAAPEVKESRESVNAQAQHVASTENEERLDERLTACLEQLRRDFDRGIVLIGEKSTPEQYAMALKADKTAGQKWETLEARLRANGADLLKKAAAMPGGACLVGVYGNGDLAIRQRSQEIMNAIWTEERKDGWRISRGELLLLPHAEAVALPKREWASAPEIVRAVREAGYHLPAGSPNLRKEGLVAASEAVTGDHYVMSADGNESRSAILECDEDVSVRVAVHVVGFNPHTMGTSVHSHPSYIRAHYLGAVLWLRG